MKHSETRSLIINQLVTEEVILCKLVTISIEALKASLLLLQFAVTNTKGAGFTNTVRILKFKLKYNIGK